MVVSMPNPDSHGEPCRFCGEKLIDLEVAHKLLDGRCFECAIKSLNGKLDAVYKQHDMAIQLLQRVNEKRPEIQTVALILGILIQDPSAITEAHDDLVITQRQLLDSISSLVKPDGGGDQALYTAVAELKRDLELAEGALVQVCPTCKCANAFSERSRAQVRASAEFTEKARALAKTETSRTRWRGLAEDRARELAAESVKVKQLREELDCALHVVIEAAPGHAGLDCCGCVGCEWVKTWLIDNGHLEADGE